MGARVRGWLGEHVVGHSERAKLPTTFSASRLFFSGDVDSRRGRRRRRRPSGGIQHTVQEAGNMSQTCRRQSLRLLVVNGREDSNLVMTDDGQSTANCYRNGLGFRPWGENKKAGGCW